VLRPDDRHASVFQRLAQRLERGARELGQLIEGRARIRELGTVRLSGPAQL
jgi:hypothetical protein